MSESTINTVMPVNSLILAARLDKARKVLQDQLFADFTSANLVLLSCTQQLACSSSVASIITNRQRDGDSVQGNSFVQDNLRQQLANCLQESDNSVHLSELHFLPGFLIEVAQQCLIELNKACNTKQHAALAAAVAELGYARQQMIAGNLGLVASIAHRQKTSNLAFDDLLQEGVIGLIKAVDRFDITLGYQFSTYATYWIKQAISRLISNQERIVRLPVALAEKSGCLFETMRSCYLQNERWPSMDEVKQSLQEGGSDLSEDEIKNLYSYYQSTHSLDAVSESEDGDGLEFMSRLKQQQFALPLDELIDGNLGQYLSRAIDSLPAKEADIINMRFGLKNHTEMTLQAVADQLQVTRERVRQIQNQALQKLKNRFGFDLILFLEPNDSY